MKDVTSATINKAARNVHVYPKKRPSPRDGGISKRRSPAQQPPRKLSPAILESRRRQLVALQEKLLLEEEYRAEVTSHMRHMELLTMSSAASMDQQPEIRWHMRPCLVDFLIEVHLTFRLRPETLYLTFNIIDRYVSRRVVYVKHYQLVGCTALWIAAKFEDAKDRVPTAQELAHICRDCYDESAFVQMEKHVLNTISWAIGAPSAEAWLRLACCGFGVEDPKTQHIARFLMEITLFHREYINYPSSAVACGALILARFTVGKTRRPHEETELGLEIVDLLDKYLVNHAHELSEILVKKYSPSYYSKASTHVLQFYLEGRRFVHQPIPTLPPITPMSSSVMGSPRTPVSVLSTPSSSISSSGSFVSNFSCDSDDMPTTPTSPTYGPDPLVMPPTGLSVLYPPTGKENTTSSGISESMIGKLHLHGHSDEMTSVGQNDCSNSGNLGPRLVLHELNGVASSPYVVR